MMSPRMVSNFPFWIDDGPLPYLDDTVARGKSCVLTGSNQIHMSPLITMVVDVIRDFTQQHSTTSNESAPNGMAAWSAQTSGRWLGSISKPITGRALPRQNRRPLTVASRIRRRSV